MRKYRSVRLFSLWFSVFLWNDNAFSMTFVLVLLLCLAFLGVPVLFFLYKRRARRGAGAVFRDKEKIGRIKRLAFRNGEKRNAVNRPVLRIKKTLRPAGNPVLRDVVRPDGERVLPSGQIVSDYNVKHLFLRDKQLGYSSDLQRYTFRDVPLTYVDEAVEACFPAFQAVELSEKEAMRTGEHAIRIRERWEAESEEALKLGRFLHRQIEHLLHGHPVQYSFCYSYVGKEYALSRTTSMSQEINQFIHFLQDFPVLQGFRSAWVVFDEEARLAGVVDFLATDADGRFVLIDWKRSRTFGQEKEGVFVLATPHAHAVPDALGGVSDVLAAVPDTPFGRETLHLNLLRLILARRYGLRVDGLRVLLLHADYASYHLLDVPVMEAVAEAVFRRWSDRDAV